MARTSAASVDVFEIYLIEDWVDGVSTRYYVGSSFHAQHQTRFQLHQDGKGNAKLLSEEMAKGDAEWTTRVIDNGHGTVVDAITLESLWFNKYKDEDPRRMLNRQDPLTQALTPEARRAAGLGLAATGYHQSAYGQSVHSELGKAAWAGGTPEERSERSRKAAQAVDPEIRKENARRAGQIGGRKGGIAVHANRTPEERSAFGRLGGSAPHKPLSPETIAAKAAKQSASWTDERKAKHSAFMKTLWAERKGGQ